MDVLSFVLGHNQGKAGGSAGGSGIIEVDELPTENIDENAVYRVNGYSDVEVYLVMGRYSPSTLTETVRRINPTAKIAYYVVDTKPANPLLSDLATFSELNVYIENDIPYIFGNAGAGAMWLLGSALLTQVFSAQGETVEDRGYIENISFHRETESTTTHGLYVTYKKNAVAVPQKVIYSYDGEWNSRFDDFVGMITGFIENVNVPNGVIRIGHHAFHNKIRLKSVTIPESVRYIDASAFENNDALVEITMAKGVIEIAAKAFASCNYLTRINYTGTKEEWKAIDKERLTELSAWDYQTDNYTIYCTDGTIAKDGTET